MLALVLALDLLVQPPLAPVPASAAADDADHHDDPAQHLEDAADVAQDDAVAHADVDPGLLVHRRDVADEVGVPGDGDDDQDAGGEEQEPGDGAD